MAASLGKPARLMIEGATTEADKTIVEAISEPLLHVMRNGLDHGLENAAERAAWASRRSPRSICARRGRASTSSSRSRTTGAASTSRRVRAVAAARGVASDGRHRRDERRRGHRSDLRAGLLDGVAGDRPVGTRRRHGRRAHDRRTAGRAGVRHQPAGARHAWSASSCRSR